MSNKFLDTIGLSHLAEKMDDRFTKLSSVAKPYDATLPYKRGEIVLVGTELKQAIENIDTPEAYDPAHWDDAVIADVVGKVEVDTELSGESENPVQNKVIFGSLQAMGCDLEYDAETSMLYMINADGERIGDGVQVTGGGGGGAQYVPKLTNLLPDRVLTVASGSPVVLAFNYQSVDEHGVDDGDGIGTITVNDVLVKSFTVPQGDNSLDITEYMHAGANNVTLRVTNSEGARKSLPYTVNVVAIAISTTFDDMATYSGAVTFGYTIVGSGSKTIHFIMDGTQIGTTTTTVSGRSLTFQIPEQADGPHIFEAYAEVLVDTVNVRSNTLRIGMLYIDSQTMQPYVLTTFNRDEATQGELLSIPYMVYDPASETTSVTLAVLDEDGETYSSQTITVGRDAQMWNISNYPAGDIQFVISCGSASATLSVDVEEYVFPLEPITDSLLLEFDAIGRSNGEENPAQWHYGDYVASFSGFGWTDVDGWIDDADNAPVLRFLPGDEMVIPLKPFATDARDTGYTIDVELATRDVRNYESIVASCMDNGRGFRIQSQEAMLSSEQSSVAMQFKEDSRVRVTFSIEQRNLDRLIYIYINGVMCGVTQYPTNDNFAQVNPVNITIGAQSCGLDLHRIRIYNKGLTRSEQLDNFICDRSSLAERRDAYERNDILNESDEVVISKLPLSLPYMILHCAELPQFKGDKKTGASVTFVDREDTSRSWTATGVELDVQGTSSAGYPVKNYKIKLKNGITYTASGATNTGFPISPGAIPTKTICFKADYASSENANNVVLAEFYNDTVPYQTPPQEANPKVRQGIEGFGIALFWQDENGQTTFIGKGNCNVDKSNEKIFGFTSDYPAAESWEFKNNTSNRVLFKSADFSGSDWLNDFEARYPDTDPAYEDPTRLQRVVSWVASTDRDAVSSEEDKAARLQKFKDEFEDYFIKDSLLFYYLFTEVFLMVDNRAKNMFLTTYDGTHWLTLPYDFDTAIGINNEGALVFGYWLEDTDTVGGAEVFNGQNSVLWNNVRDAFAGELADMYADLRSGTAFSYDVSQNKFTDHQSVWPEALWNEDAFIKYLQPFLLDNQNYLSMLQGNKASQRDWWLFNAFRYRDSKYKTGDAESNFITLRCYEVGDITVTPYSNIWPRVKYGSYTAFNRGERNQSYVMHCGLDQMNDTETYIYSADRMASVGDLSHLKVGYANFSMATKLQDIKLGSNAVGYENTRLKEFYVGNNELLTTVDLTNCTAMGTDTQKAIDLSGCASLTTVKLSGTALKGVNLPIGGHLETLLLPGTISNLTIQNQKLLNTLTFDDYGELETLRIENTPNIPIATLVAENSEVLNRVRLINVDWTEDSETSLEATFDILDGCIGMDASGNNTPHAVVTGKVRVPSISAQLLADINDAFPELVVIANGVPQYVARYLNRDGTVLYRTTVSAGGTCIDPVAAGTIPAPDMPDQDGVRYSYTGWDHLPTNVQSNVTIIAQYETQYAIYCMNGSALYNTQWVSYGGNGTAPSNPSKAATPQYTYAFQGWSKSSEATTVDADAFNNITAPRTLYAVYTETLRTYTVRWYNGSTLLETDSNVPYGGTATYDGATPTPPTDFRFKGFEPDGTNIQGDTNCYAQFEDTRSPITTYLAGTMTDYVSGPDATKVGTEAFYNMTSLKSIKTQATLISSRVIGHETNVTSNVEVVDCSNESAITFEAGSFSGGTSLTHLIVRSKTVSIMANSAVLNNTKIARGEGAIYVPDDLVESYRAATNWSLFTILPISAYPATDFSTISDTWNEIIANANYSTDYKVGDVKSINIDGSIVYMQLVGLDVDEKADGSGKARMSWISKAALATAHSMNSEATTSGGWALCNLRSYLQEELLLLLPSEVQNAIVEVDKTYRTKDPEDTTLSIADKIWIPSHKEVGLSYPAYVENDGIVYNGIYIGNNNSTRVKYTPVSNTCDWWLRTAYSSQQYCNINASGSHAYTNANLNRFVVFGFCI